MPDDIVWEIVEKESIQQGDIIIGCIILKYPPETIQHARENPEEPLEIEYDFIDTIILTQSCDLEHGKMENILVAPVYELSEFRRKNPEINKGDLEGIRKGNTHRFYSLRPCIRKGFEREETIVDFRNIFTIPKDALYHHVKTLGKRHRLLPVFIEHLARAFGDSISRIALPDA